MRKNQINHPSPTPPLRFFDSSSLESDKFIKHFSTDSPSHLIHAVHRIVANSNHTHPRIATYESYHIEHAETWKVTVEMKKMKTSLAEISQSHATNPHQFTLSELVNHFYSLLSALESLHNIGQAHKNIKPENILFDENHIAYLADCASYEAKYQNQSESNLNSLQIQEEQSHQTMEEETEYTEDLKALGFIFLAMCNPSVNLEHFSEISNQPAESIYKNFSSVTSNYGKELSDFLSLMVFQDTSQPITASILCRRLENRYKEILIPFENLPQGSSNRRKRRSLKMEDSDGLVSLPRVENLPSSALIQNPVDRIRPAFKFIPWLHNKPTKVLAKCGVLKKHNLALLKKCSKLGAWQPFKKVGKKIDFHDLTFLQTHCAQKLPQSAPPLTSKVQKISKCISRIVSPKELQLEFTSENITMNDISVFGKNLLRFKQLKSLRMSFTSEQVLNDCGLELLGKVVQKMVKLEDLHFSLNKWVNVTDKGLALFCHAISKLEKLKKLVLDIEELPRIGESNLDSIGQNIACLSHLKELGITFFRCSSISGKHLSALSEHLSRFRGLRKLMINMKQSKEFMTEGVISLSQALLSLTKLQELKLNLLSCDIAETGLTSLGETFERLSQLQTLDLTFGNSDQVNNTGFEAIANSLPKLNQLRSLRLVFFQCDKLTDSALCCLAESLKNKITLNEVELNFRWCMQITDYSINKLGEAFLGLVYLNKLGLSFDGCRISDAGVSKLGQDLAKLQYLDGFKLEVRECKRIQGSGISKLGQCLTKLVRLGQIQLNFCGCGGAYRQRFNEGILSLRKSISQLPNVNQNTISPHYEG